MNQQQEEEEEDDKARHEGGWAHDWMDGWITLAKALSLSAASKTGENPINLNNSQFINMRSISLKLNHDPISSSSSSPAAEYTRQRGHKKYRANEAKNHFSQRQTQQMHTAIDRSMGQMTQI